MLPDVIKRQMAQPFLPALVMAGTAIAGKIASGKRQGQQERNQYGEKYRAKVWEEQNFDPYGPFRRGVRGAVWAAQMKVWGMDKLFPKEMLDYVANPANVPGTKGMLPGGKEYSQPTETGMPNPKTGMGFWDYMSAGFAGAGAAGAAVGTGSGSEGGYPGGPPEVGTPSGL